MSPSDTGVRVGKKSCRFWATALSGTKCTVNFEQLACREQKNLSVLGNRLVGNKKDCHFWQQAYREDNYVLSGITDPI